MNRWRATIGLVVIVAACSGDPVIEPDPSVATTLVGTTSSVPATTETVATTGSTLTTSTPSTSMAVSSAAPSQSPADAVRDGVVQAIAALTPPQRINPLLTADAEEGTWVLSVLTDDVINESLEGNAGCAIGDSGGEYFVDFVCSVEYGEFLLLDDRSEVVKAFPMPGAKPSWIHVTDQWVYGGRIGDGALPDATIVRIDRLTLEAKVVVMPAPIDGGTSWPQGWFVATQSQLDAAGRLVGMAGDFDGQLVESWIGPIAVDIPAIDRFLSEFEPS